MGDLWGPQGLFPLVFASLVYVAAVVLTCNAIPRLYFELRFYLRNNFDLKKESSVVIFGQQNLKKLFSFLPIGAIKLAYHAARSFIFVDLIQVGIKVAYHYYSFTK
jgi:hypothetical protein